MGQKRFASLAVLSIESQLLRDFDFSSVIDIFAEDTKSFLIVTYTAKNNITLTNFLVSKFYGKAQFLHSFGRFVRSHAKTVLF